MPLTDPAVQKNVLRLRRICIGICFAVLFGYLSSLTHNFFDRHGIGQYNLLFMGAAALGGQLLGSLGPASNWLDLLLFYRFDLSVMQRITRVTGLLVWHPPTVGPVHNAWHELETWVRQDAHHGRWNFGRLLRLGALAPQDAPFRYALLLGVNGIGKSQLAMEFGRHLADRAHLGSKSKLPQVQKLRRRTAIWGRRTIPWKARHHADPWDAGLLTTTQPGFESALENWRPSAPSFLILDDPDDSKAAAVTKILSTQAVHYWYPVRLLIIAQFRPPVLRLTTATTDPTSPVIDQTGTKIKIIQLGNVTWNALEYRAAAYLYWPERAAEPASTAQNKKFWQPAALEPLVEVLEGNPMLLAEATIWLTESPENTIAGLLNVQNFTAWEQELFPDLSHLTGPPQALVVHRIIGARMKTLYDDHRNRYRAAYPNSPNPDADEDALFTAIIVASLAGLPQADLRALKTLVPENFALPPSWPFIENYALYAIGERKLSLPDLIRQAYRTRPAGVLRGLRQKGELAAAVAKVLDTLPDDPAQPDVQLDLFAGAIYRALWLDRDAIPTALTRLQNLAPASLGAARAKLIEYGTATPSLQPDRVGHVPDIVAALLLLTAIGAREFLPPINLTGKEWQNFATQWDRWLDRCNFDLRYVPAFILDPLKTVFRTLCAAMFQGLWAIEDAEIFFGEAEKIDARILNLFKYPINLELEAVLPPPSHGDVPFLGDSPIATLRTIYSDRWHAFVLFARGELGTLETLLNKGINRLAGIEYPFFTPEQKTYFTAKNLALMCMARSQYNDTKPTAQEMAEELDRVAQPFPGDAPIQTARAYAWQFVTYAWCETPDAEQKAEAAAAMVEQIEDNLPSNQAPTESLIMSWENLTFTYRKSPGHSARIEALIKKIETTTRKLHPSIRVQRNLVSISRNLAFNLATTSDHQRMVDAIVVRTSACANAFPDDARVQLYLGWAKRQSAFARAELLDPNRPVDDITKWAETWVAQFMDSAEHQEVHANIWRSAAYERCRLQERRATTIVAAYKVNAIAAPFPPDHAGLQDARAEAWSQVAFAYSQTPELRARTRKPLATILKIAKRFPDDPKFQLSLIKAWKYLAFARLNLSSQKHLVGHAVAHMFRIAARFPNDNRIQAELHEIEKATQSLSQAPAP
jgi:hypothetical protein